MRALIYCGLCASALTLSACGTTESGSLLTSGMSAVMSVGATGDNTTTVTVELFSGTPEQLIFVDLDDSDTLIATAAGQTMTMTKGQLATIIEYAATFTGDDSGDEFMVSLDRTVDAGAPSSTATLPDAFTLGAAPTSQSRASALTLTWSPSGSSDAMTWQASGDCITTASGTIAGDPGTVTIPAATLTAEQGQSTASCSVTMTVSRSSAGTLDAHFGDGGTISAQQSRTTTFTSTP
jgi:hypothetical protein